MDSAQVASAAQLGSLPADGRAEFPVQRTVVKTAQDGHLK